MGAGMKKIAAVCSLDEGYMLALAIIEKSCDVGYFADTASLHKGLEAAYGRKPFVAIILPSKKERDEIGFLDDLLIYVLATGEDIVFIKAGIATLVEFDRIKTFGELLSFQNRNKYLLMMYHQLSQKKLGHLTARLDGEFGATLAEYRRILVASLSTIPTAGQINNTLLHVFGYFKNNLSPVQKNEFLDALNDYRKGEPHLKTLLDMLYRYSQVYQNDYLRSQSLFQHFR